MGFEKREAVFELAFEHITKLVDEGYTDFILESGQFRNLARSVLTIIRMRNPKIKRVYFAKSDDNIAELYDRKLYDEIYPFRENGIKKDTITHRHQAMIDKSDYCIFYVVNRAGELQNAMQYAKDKGKTLVNLASIKV